MITATLIAALASFQIACEKDVDQPSASMENNSTKSTKKSLMNNKSGGLSYTLIDNYVSELEANNSPGDEMYDLSLLMIESAINHTEATPLPKSTHSELIEFSAEVDITSSAEGFIIEGADALDLYTELVSELNSAIDNSSLFYSYGGDAFVSVIDLTIDGTPSEAGSIGVSGQAMLKFDVEPDIPYCYADNNWKALDQLGKCTGGHFIDAAMRIESMISNTSCNSLKMADWCTAYYASHITFATNSGFSTSNLWDGTSTSTCINASAINNTWEPGALTEASSMEPAVYNVHVDYMMGKLNAASPSTNVAHELTVSYADVWCPPIDPL